MPVAAVAAAQAQRLHNNLTPCINILLPAALVALAAGRLELQITPCPQRLQPTLAAAAAARAQLQEFLAPEAPAVQV